jgi:hypothetical protein
MRLTACLLSCFLCATYSDACRAQQTPDPQQALQGLLTGDKAGDRIIVEAFQRGYQRGAEDSQRQCRADIARALKECKKAQ